MTGKNEIIEELLETYSTFNLLSFKETCAVKWGYSSTNQQLYKVVLQEMLRMDLIQPVGNDDAVYTITIKGQNIVDQGGWLYHLQLAAEPNLILEQSA